MFKSLLIFAVVSLSIIGCANTGSSALRIKAETSITFPLATERWEEGTAHVATKDIKGCGRFSQDILPSSGDQDFNFGIEGNKDIFFRLTRSDSLNKCDFSGMFYAVKGHEYILNIDISNKTCNISLHEITPKGTQIKINTYPVHVSNVDGVRVCENKDNLYR